jgi:hypothetical protein
VHEQRCEPGCDCGCPPGWDRIGRGPSAWIAPRRSAGSSPARAIARNGKGPAPERPRVTRVAAEILARYPGSSANLVRALIGAAARPLQVPDALDPKGLRRAAGYGLLSDKDALDSGRSRVALMYEGEMAPDTAAIHPVPVPREFIESSSTRRITVALAFDPEVRRTRREYLTANMKVDLVRGLPADEIESRWQKRPPKDKGRRDLPKSARNVKAG